MHTLDKKSKTTVACHLLIDGMVQGVGLRPFIFRLATRQQLKGWIRNTGASVEVLLQGNEENIQLLIKNLSSHQLPLLRIDNIRQTTIQTKEHLTNFSIADSLADKQTTRVIQDYAICEKCKQELFTPGNRRYHYPFTSCSNCGPRYALLTGYPLDRKNSTLTQFAPCSSCSNEYADDSNRRFYAQNICCQKCGPQLFRKVQGETSNINIIDQCVSYLKEGKIVAMKSSSGYKLICDATNRKAISLLRKRKNRPHKPFAVMLPDAESIKSFTTATHSEIKKLSQKEQPIVICRVKPNKLPENIHPQLTHIGICLPGNGLEILITKKLNRPIIFTSGNKSGQPILARQDQAESLLVNIADYFVHHDMEIVNPTDDSVWKMIAGLIRPLRLGKGYTPMELESPYTLRQPVIALGAQMKNCIAIAWEKRIIISPHIGDTGTYNNWIKVLEQINSLKKLYQIEASHFLVDSHPDYTSRQWVKRHNKSHTEILHHHAHASAVASIMPKDEKLLVFTWDGTGLGEQKKLWGGETFYGKPGNWQRVASLKPFLLPCSEQAINQPWRIAASLLWHCQKTYESDQASLQAIYKAWKKKFNCPATSSVGRLFDGVSALLGLASKISHDGQAAMLLEACANDPTEDFISLPIIEEGNQALQINWIPLVLFIKNNVSKRSYCASVFHNTLAHIILNQCLIFRRRYLINHIGLSGGVFQNALLAQKTQALLKQYKFKCYINESLPVNDAQISFGQIIEYAAQQH